MGSIAFGTLPPDLYGIIASPVPASPTTLEGFESAYPEDLYVALEAALKGYAKNPASYVQSLAALLRQLVFRDSTRLRHVFLAVQCVLDHRDAIPNSAELVADVKSLAFRELKYPDGLLLDVLLVAWNLSPEEGGDELLLKVLECVCAHPCLSLAVGDDLLLIRACMRAGASPDMLVAIFPEKTWSPATLVPLDFAEFQWFVGAVLDLSVIPLETLCLLGSFGDHMETMGPELGARYSARLAEALARTPPDWSPVAPAWSPVAPATPGRSPPRRATRADPDRKASGQRFKHGITMGPKFIKTLNKLLYQKEHGVPVFELMMPMKNDDGSFQHKTLHQIAANYPADSIDDSVFYFLADHGLLDESHVA